jgi:hypothetical protein
LPASTLILLKEASSGIKVSIVLTTSGIPFSSRANLVRLSRS